ncbi:MAG: hypothetical protein HQ553_14205 [Chloroflexi bacterium]|nr:hypothetical protein [Chloroflexota bacterium]
MRIGSKMVAILVAVILLSQLLLACSDSDTTKSDPSEIPSPTGTAQLVKVPNLPPENLYLADSVYALAHGDSAQQDSTAIPGPTGPTQQLKPNQIIYQPIGPGHFGIQISSPYDDGRRVIWSNGGDRIVKLDHDTFEVLATYEIPGKKVWTAEESEEAVIKLETLEQQERMSYAMQLAAKTLMGLAGVYALLDKDGNFYVGNAEGLTVYGDDVESNPDSEIVIRATWELPDEISGQPIGMNMTYDGWLILVTDDGQVIALSRDFSEFYTVKMHHSENAAEYSQEMRKAGKIGYGWVRNPYAIDEAGGIWIVSNDYMHKVVWTGSRLSIDEADGAWTEPYLNGSGLGSGSGVSLMGFGDEDKLVVISDGEDLMNVVLYWRNEIPEDWQQLPGTPSRRTAGMAPANMGDPNRTAIQSEQSVIVSGYGAVVVNNEPASIPENFAGPAIRLLVAHLGSDPDFTPYGVQKFEWDPEAKELRESWVNNEVSSTNGVPYVSLGSNILYFVGVRDGKWGVEGLDWTTSESAFHWVVGGEQYNSLYSGLHLDQEGRIIFGTTFGKVRLEP